MTKMKKMLVAATLAGAAALPLSSAQAWWGGGPWDGSGWGDMNFSMHGSGWGRGYGYPYYGGYGPYGWGGGPYGWGGYPGYGGWGGPYGWGGYPGYGGWGGYPGYGVPYAVPAAPATGESK